MLKIGNIKIKHPVILAPMAGVTDLPFRLICKNMGASIMYTEFVSAEGIIRENLKTLNMIKFTEEERPIGVQIFGDNPVIVGESAQYIYKNFKPDIIDINYGCPVPKITKRGAGSAALKDLSLMKEITQSVIHHVPEIPITAKIRAGWDNNSIVAVEAGLLLESLGVSAVTIHARTTKQGFTGHSNWNIIKDMKKELKIPLFGNGDVVNLESFQSMKEHTKCDAIMIGRGALGNPWIFKEINAHLENKIFTGPNECDKITICLEHINLLEKYKSNIACLNLSKKHINYYIKNFNNSSILRRKLMRLSSIEDIKNELMEVKINYFSSCNNL